MEPVLITARASELCRAAAMPSGPHTAGYINVYVNDLGYKLFTKHDKVLPIGTIVVKEKLGADDHPNLLTVMIKRSKKGSVDDWQFYALAGDGSHEVEADLPKCRSCHESAGPDHLFRSY